MELYKLTFPNNKIYIGITSNDAKHRFRQHCNSQKKYPIVLAIKKYGKENVILEVLGTYENWESLYAAEQSAIEAYGSRAPAGYNLTDGGKGTFGCPASEERKRKIANAHRGRKHSIEHGRRIAEANKGRCFDFQVEAMRKANLGRKRSAANVKRMKEVWVGRKHSPESIVKMSESAKRRKASPETKLKMSMAIKGRKMSKESLLKRKATTAANKCKKILH